MPSLQVVDQGTPSFGNRLINSFQQGYDNKKDEQILGGLNPNMSPLELVQSIGKLSKDKQKSLEPYFEQIIKGGASGGMAGGALPWDESGAAPWDPSGQMQPPKQNEAVDEDAQKLAKLEQQLLIAERHLDNPNRKVGAKIAHERFQNEIANVKDTIETKGTINRLEDLKKYAGLRFGTSSGNLDDTVRGRQEIKNLGVLLADKVWVKLNKGVVSNPKFQFLKDDIAVKPNDSPSVYQGKIDALRSFHGLPVNASAEESERALNKAQSLLNKAKKEDQKKSEVETNKVLKEASKNPSGKTKLVAPDGYDLEVPNSLVQEYIKGGARLK